MSISIFQPAAQDLSLQYMYTIFGDMDGVINAYGIQTQAGTTTLTILGTMFQAFNSIVLAVGAFVVVYVTIVGVMATAHEGQFMGKKWNNMWLPIRTVLGIASLVPTTSGYSAVQIIMMWVIVQGIGAADSLWSTTLGFVQANTSPFAKVQAVLTATTPNGTPAGLGSIAAKQALKDIFKGVVCNETARQGYQTPSILPGLFGSSPLSAGYFCSSNGSNSFCQQTAADQFSTQTLQQSNQISLGPNGSCGTINYCNYQTVCNSSNTLAAVAGSSSGPGGLQSTATADAYNGGSAAYQQTLCTLCTNQTTVLSAILIEFAAIADKLAQDDDTYAAYFYGGSSNNNQSSSQPQPPPLVQSYCKSNNINQQNCVAIKVTNTSSNSNNSNQSTPQVTYSSAGLPAPYTSDSFSQSASQYVVDKVYLPDLLQISQVQNTNVNSSTNSNSNANVDFMTILLSMYQTQTAPPNDNAPPQLGGIYQAAGDQGWLVAGAYYYTISGFIKDSISSLIPPLSYSPPDPDLIVPDNFLQSACDGKACRTNFDAAGYFLTALEQGNNTDQFGGSASSSSGSSSVDAISGPISDTTSTINAAFTNTMSSSSSTSSMGRGATDPVANLILAGSIILYVIQVLFLILLVILFVTGLAGNLSIYVLGTGVANPIGPTVSLMLALLMPALLGFMGICISVGGILGVYVPLIPFVIFTLGAIGWFTSVIEAMVAGPLVALGILSPAGQHELLGKAEPALGFLFNIFLRPSLMIFGLVAAVLLAGTMIDLLNTTFGMMFTQVGNGGAGGPVGLILFLVAYVSLVTTVLNKCFAAIHIIPEKVGRWIGMQGEQYGESADTLKGAIESGAAKASGAMHATGEKAVAAKVRSDEGKKAKKEEGKGDISAE